MTARAGRRGGGGRRPWDGGGQRRVGAAGEEVGAGAAGAQALADAVEPEGGHGAAAAVDGDELLPAGRGRRGEEGGRRG